MKFEREGLPAPKLDMTPMIDVVFQLMIFFMLTLKIVSLEGNFDINMPIGAICFVSPPDSPEIKVRLISDENGALTKLQLGQRVLGNDDRAFALLNSEILKIIGRPGNPLTKDVEVEIDADYSLDYAYVIQTISACTGKIDPRTKQPVQYIEKIKFAPPRTAV